ncbi:hypothetical protein G210_4597 [Candida maltosa Xu316]|uniref:Protein PBN1 n=1 Tax=Candida maltosa (strain Xu316) TaxID=1245528 RepID=M3K6B2_CANMX|nr:hypothetical protein G210_4597 [Candida maltosa Xu316]
MKQRTTVFSIDPNYEDLITNVNQTNFQVTSQPDKQFIIENKYTVEPTKKYPNIQQFRIQTKFEDPLDSIFNFGYSRGLNVYAVPVPHYKEVDFWNEVNELTNELLNITITPASFVRNLNSYYYHDIQPIDLINDKLTKGVNYDYAYNSDKVIIRELLQNVDNVNYNLKTGIKKEIGLFWIDEKFSNKQDKSLRGFRVLLDEENSDEKNVHKTMFDMISKHAHLEKSTSKIIPQGLHPIVNTKIPDSTVEYFQSQGCKLYYYINVNKSLIFDPFQNVPSGSQLVINNGNKNLELPEYKIPEWGNEVLFEFDDIISEVNLTLHSRYQLPENNREQATTIFNSPPDVFIGCNTDKVDVLNASPFDTKRDIQIGRYFAN